MTDLATCPHGNLSLPASEPWPAGSHTPYCRPCWAGERASKTTRRGACLHLGPRVEFRPGCGGRMCRHECLAGEPEAVPGGVCQTCPKWESET